MGISLAGADRMAASGNRITVAASGPGFGIELVGGKWLSAIGNSIVGPIGMPVSVDSVENVQIIGNTFNGAEGSSYGIGLQVIDGGSDQTPLTVAKHVQIIGNVFSDFTCRAIQVQTDCEDVVIQGNVFRDNTKVDLYIQQARFLTIVGNTFDCRGITGSGGDWKFMFEAEHGDGGGHIIVANRFLGDKSTSGIPSGVTSIVANNYGVA